MKQCAQLVLSAKPPLSIRQKCQLLGVNRSTVYYEKESDTNLNDQNVMQEIRDLYGPHPFLGYRRIRNFLRKKG